MMTKYKYYFIFSATLWITTNSQWPPQPPRGGLRCPPEDPLCLGPAGRGQNFGPPPGNRRPDGGNFQGQGGGFGSQGGGFGGGGGGKGRREPSYYINQYATKVGDVISAKNGNGQYCAANSQVRAASSKSLGTLVGEALMAARSGRCAKGGPGGGMGGGPTGGGHRGPPRWDMFGGRVKRQQSGFGGPGGGCPSTVTCDNGNRRVQSLYREVLQNGKRLVVANGIPDHCYHTQQINPNPNRACEHFQYIYAEANATVSGGSRRFKQTPMGPVGIAVSGAYLYNHKSAESCNVAAIQEKESFDSCDGHADPSCRYHYHKAPICITGWQNCGLMGYLMDGIPVYGECTIRDNRSGGKLRLKSCYHLKQGSLGCSADNDYEWREGPDCHLDKANGMYFDRDTRADDGHVFRAGEYAYFVTPEYPFLMPYYVGEDSMCMLQS